MLTLRSITNIQATNEIGILWTGFQKTAGTHTVRAGIHHCTLMQASD